MDHQDKRLHKLLFILAEQRDYMTADDLSHLMNVSKKSIYRAIKTINETSVDRPLIVSERGKGYKLDYDLYMTQEGVDQQDMMDPQTRQTRVMETLLLCSPQAVKVADLYSTFYVSDSTINLDEKMISEKLRSFDLKLLRQNKRLAIIGKEMNVRRALLEMIQPLEVMDMEEFSLSNHFNKYDALFVSDRLREIERYMGSLIPYPYNINIFSHLYILIARSRRGQTEDDDQELDQMVEEANFSNERYLHIAESIIQTTENYLHRSLSKREVLYLYQYLISSRLSKDPDPTIVYSEELREMTNDLIKRMGEKLHRHFNDPKLVVDLIQHMKPLRNRLVNGIRIHNPLLGQIQVAYPDIFKCLQEVIEEIRMIYHLPEITADEIGFLTVYFARAVETSVQAIRTIVMCTTGLGTSELIRVKVKKKFPELEVIRVVSRYEIDQILEEMSDIELVLTTIAYSPKIAIPTLLISAMLTTKDCMRIQEMIDALTKEGRRE